MINVLSRDSQIVWSGTPSYCMKNDEKLYFFSYNFLLCLYREHNPRHNLKGWEILPQSECRGSKKFIWHSILITLKLCELFKSHSDLMENLGKSFVWSILEIFSSCSFTLSLRIRQESFNFDLLYFYVDFIDRIFF